MSQKANGKSVPAGKPKDFYLDNLHDWIQRSDVSKSDGASMLNVLRTELMNVESSTTEVAEYKDATRELHKTLTDGLMSGVHRRIPYYHVNRSISGDYHVTTDEEELEFAGFAHMDSDEETEDDDDDEEFELRKNPPKASQAPPVDQKLKKREETKKRRQEDENLLLNERRVRDDKGQLLNTLGPHPPPRLTYRAAKAGHTFPSRKTLNQRLNVDQSITEEDDIDFTPSTNGPSPGVDAVDHLTEFLRPLSIDSLKKISESAKVKINLSAEKEEIIDQIVKCAVRVGCEKACMLMDKYKIIDQVTSHANATHSSVSAMGPIGASVEFLKSLPDDLKEALGPVLGMPKDKSSVSEMWERIVAMGFLAVLGHLRQRPVKKMVQEMSLKVSDHLTTDKQAEAIVLSAFPDEVIRMKNARIRQQGIMFSVVQSRQRVFGDMGFITFVVQNISSMRRDIERHYSPEFEFGSLKWSLLCMANKENLALYLCQTGTVYCKFVITVVNKNPDESICNEGTQKFTSSSAENDWGFNSVIKFDTLLNQKNGFWNAENDSISIEVGIVFVEAIEKAQAAKAEAKSKSDAGSKAAEGKTGKEKVTAKQAKQRQEEEKRKQEEEFARQREALLETERLEALRKKLKTDITKVQKDEEKVRREISQKAIKTLQGTADSYFGEKNRIVREQRERERRDQAERQRERERIRQAQEANTEMKRRITELGEESVNLSERKKVLTTEIAGTKSEVTAAQKELSEIDAEISRMLSAVKKQEKQLTGERRTLNLAKKELADSPQPSTSSDEESSESEVEEEPVEESSPEASTGGNVDETELMKALRQSLAGIIGN